MQHPSDASHANGIERVRAGSVWSIGFASLLRLSPGYTIAMTPIHRAIALEWLRDWIFEKPGAEARAGLVPAVVVGILTLCGFGWWVEAHGFQKPQVLLVFSIPLVLLVRAGAKRFVRKPKPEIYASLPVDDGRENRGWEPFRPNDR